MTVHIAPTVPFSNAVELAAYALASHGGMPRYDVEPTAEHAAAYEALVDACERHPCHPEALAIVSRIIMGFNY